MGCIFSHPLQHSPRRRLPRFKDAHSSLPPPPRQSPSDELEGSQHSLSQSLFNEFKFSSEEFNIIVSSPSPQSSWGELPEELLILIFQRITYLSDFESCLAVCTLWRSTAKILLRRTAATPFIMSLIYKKLFTSTYGHSNAPTAARKFDLDPPIKQDFYSIATSYRGWLILCLSPTCTGLYCLYNPVTRAIVNLPRLPEFFLSRLITSTSPANPNCIIYILCGLFNDMLGVCKRGDTSFKIVKFPKWMTVIKDIVFYKGELYVVDLLGALFVFKHEQNLLQKVVLKLERQHLLHINRNEDIKYNMVEEPSTGELLLVVRVLLLVSTPQENYSIRKTESFQIYKWKGSSKAVWEEITIFRTGDHRALLLASGDSVFVSTLDQDFFKPNCIYFFERSCDNILDNVSVYDLENHKLVQQPCPNLQLNSINSARRPCFSVTSPKPYRWFRASSM